ncbi:MAG TPA: M20/M25/M40 family metallo-hydrolase [Thermoanaerobaculia bacterium]|nr:M20/M25/M40 family metallo-hydrolase [Thermoanaerobaculia bacterium]
MTRLPRGFTPALAFLLLAPSVRADDPLPVETRAAVAALAARGGAQTRAVEWVRRLTDEVGPRLAGSPGDRAAVAWGQALLRELGFANVRSEEVPVKAWERGVETAEVVAPFRQRLVVAALGGSVPTPEGGIAAPIARMESLEALEEAVGADPDAVRGKIVFFSRRTVKDPAGPGYGKNVPMRASGAAKAAPYGALAVIVRSVGTSTSRFAHTGSTNYGEGGPRIPAAAVSNTDADLLERLLAKGPVTVRLVLGCRPLPDATPANVIGEVPGRERPDEVVVVSGHLDSWDLGTGAVDDGAGVAIAIEAARLVSELPRRPRRTIRVVLFANEESGLAGGKGYVARHAAELPKHAGAFEADSGTGAPQGFSWNAADTLEPALAAVAKVLEALGAGTLRKGGAGGADVSPMLASGVPLFGLRQDSATYFDVHHTADDTFDKIEPASLDKAAVAMAAMAYAVADLPEIHARPAEAPAAKPK